MSDLIDRDFIKSLGGKCIAYRDEKTNELFPIIGIDAFPSAQPEIIRCKDCVYRSIHPDSDKHYWCNQWYARLFDENGYCSRGRSE